MKKINKLSYFLFLLLVSPEQLFAQVESVGESFDVLGENLSSTQSIFRSFCYIAGLTLGVMGLFKLKNHCDQPKPGSFQEAFTRLLAGSFLIALPTLIDIITNSIFDGGLSETNLIMFTPDS